ncbi:gfo/Idh/MocA family oxidoreductase, partial [Pediococcus acidilactici]|nr:gfo/Idh/MocA family oxidoreductase [Pediococcus acidilactici]
MDKPISEILAEVTEIYQIAAEQHVLLTCGFNRRFAPLHQAFGQLGNPHLVRATKTRVMENQSPQFAVYDLMIHVIDLVQFLMGSSKVEYVDGR